MEKAEWHREVSALAARAVVVGAGIVGLMAAYHLRRQGLDVTVIDRADPGTGCSAGNAGFICPSLSAPLPAPGLVGRSLRSMLSRESPLYIAPSALPLLGGWLLAFWRRCNAADNEAGLAAMLALNRRTIELYDALSDDGVAFEMHRRGLLFCFLDARALQAEYEDLRRIARYGYAPPVLRAKGELAAEEPALSDAVVGAVALPGERHVEPVSLATGVAERLRSLGVEIVPGTTVLGFERNHGSVRAVLTTEGRVALDLVAITAGAHSGRLAADLGVRLPVQAGKGYSVTYPGLAAGVRHALYLGETKTVVSQYDGALRVAGTMEFSGLNQRLSPARVRGLRAAARRYLRAPLPEEGQAWVGMRPMLPDGLPAIGRLPGLENAFVSTGHATNGVFMAPASGLALAQLAVGGAADVDLAPFDPGRFQHGRRS